LARPRNAFAAKLLCERNFAIRKTKDRKTKKTVVSTLIQDKTMALLIGDDEPLAWGIEDPNNPLSCPE